MLSTLLAGTSAYNLAFRQRNPSLSQPGAYVESVARLTSGQQVAELELACSSLEYHRLAMPEELQLLQQEVARMKYKQRLGIQQPDGGYLSSPTLNSPTAELRALEAAEKVVAPTAAAPVAAAPVAAATKGVYPRVRRLEAVCCAR